jgi:hypothetical protein
VRSFEEDLVIGELRFASGRLENILKAMENDEFWRENFISYALKLAEVEKSLKKIRNSNLEILEKYFV